MMVRVGVPRRLILLIAALAPYLALGACGELTSSKPSSSNFTDTVTVYAINGTPSSANSGLWLIGGAAIPISPAFGFDLAFDFGSSGAATMFTVRRVAGGLASVRSVGVQKITTPFDDFLKAPKDGYVVDSIATVARGDVYAIRTVETTSCSITSLSANVYAKIEILDLDAVARTVRARFTVNPNCGFFSLIPSGVPKD